MRIGHVEIAEVVFGVAVFVRRLHHRRRVLSVDVAPQQLRKNGRKERVRAQKAGELDGGIKKRQGQGSRKGGRKEDR